MNSSGRGLLSRRNEVFKTRITDSLTLHFFPFLVFCLTPNIWATTLSFICWGQECGPWRKKMIFCLDSSVCIQFNPILSAVIWLQLCGKHKTFILKSAFSKEAWKILRFSYSHYLCIYGFHDVWWRWVVLLYHINEQTVTFKLS